MGKTACGNCAQRWCLVVSIKGCRHHKKMSRPHPEHQVPHAWLQRASRKTEGESHSTCGGVMMRMRYWRLRTSIM